MTAETPDPLVPAASHSATRAWIRRWLGAGAALTLLGAALLGVTAQLATSADARCQAFVDAGDTTLATVLETHHSRFGDSITVQVQFTDRPPDVVDVVSDGDFAVGDDVVLAFDPQHPETMLVTPCEFQEPTRTRWLAAAGLIGLGMGLPFLVLTALLTRRLRRHPWREIESPADRWSPWYASVTDDNYTVTVDGTPLRIASGIPLVQAPVFDGDGPRTLWVAGPASGRFVPVAPPGGRRVFRGVAGDDA